MCEHPRKSRLKRENTLQTLQKISCAIFQNKNKIIKKKVSEHVSEYVKRTCLVWMRFNSTNSFMICWGNNT